MRRRTARAAAGVSLALGLLVAAAPGCAARRQRKAEDAKLLDAGALYRRAMEEVSGGNLRRARTLLERVQYTAENRTAFEPLVRLALADLAFYAGDDLSRIDARAKYLDFVTLYGDHPRAPYAQLQAGLCSLEQANHPTRDQSQTHVAIADLSEVRRRWPGSSLARAAEQMIDRAERNLAEHDFQVGYFYYKRKAWAAAENRFRLLLDRFPHFAEREKVYFHLGQCLLRMNNDVEGKLYLDKVVQDFPEGEWAEEAKKALAAMGAERGNRKG